MPDFMTVVFTLEQGKTGFDIMQKNDNFIKIKTFSQALLQIKVSKTIYKTTTISQIEILHIKCNKSFDLEMSEQLHNPIENLKINHSSISVLALVKNKGHW